MKGDFTRGHRPDNKRKAQLDKHGKKYRRVLLQEGRLVLDSDVAASVDAFDTLVRDVAADLGCRTGSPNLGYLVTPGPLFTLFERMEHVELPPQGSLFEVYRDYGRKYKERFPSLYVGGTSEAGMVTIHGRREIGKADYPKLRFWVRADADHALTVVFRDKTTQDDHEATPPAPVTASAGFVAYDVPVPDDVTSYDTIQVGYESSDADHQIWIGLVEGLQEAVESKPIFWITRGRYYLDGLEVELNHATEDDGQYPEVTFPAALQFEVPDVTLEDGDYFVAYLEGWERLITRVEDPGIMEQALGGILDTTVRSQPLGQVKVAFFDPNEGEGFNISQAGLIPKAFANIDKGTAELNITTAPTGNNPDPCAIPEAGGYTGADNRFYRFEVHTSGDDETATIKWSKNNGSDLFGVASFDELTLGQISLTPGSGVREGDLVELLFEADDLGDQSPASLAVDTTPFFRPADRDVGVLYYVQTTNKTDQIQLLDFVTKEAATLDDALATQPGPKVRIWHGLIDPAISTGVPIDIGDGISIELSGDSFRPGDYWQYEARKLKDNANGAWQKSPHGPERLFAPLALFRYDGATDLLVLEQWFDHQFSAICDLNADDIAYDGDKVGTDADTVQEAIDELYTIVDRGGCCDVHMDPGAAGDDDGARIQQVIDNQLPNGGVICLKPGVYNIETTITVDGKKIEIVGCPRATLIGLTDEPMFHIKAAAELVLAKLIARAGSGGGPVVLLRPDEGGSNDEGEFVNPARLTLRDSVTELVHSVRPPRLTLRETALVHTDSNGIAVQVGSAEAKQLDADEQSPDYPSYDSYFESKIQADDSIFIAAWILVADTASCAISDSMLVFESGGFLAGSFPTFELRRSSVVGYLDEWLRTRLQDAAADTLEATLTQELESLYGDPQDMSIAILGNTLWDATLEENVVAAGACIVTSSGEHIKSRGNSYVAKAKSAVRLDGSYGCGFDSDRFESKGPSLYIPSSAYDMRVERCFFQGRYGILFAADVQAKPLDSEPGEFCRLRVLENEFSHNYNWYDTIRAGILLGPISDNADSVFALLDKVEIARNTFSDYYSSPDLCIGCTLVDPAFDPDGQGGSAARRSIRIEDNRIFGGFVGILVLGSGYEIRRNSIVHEAQEGGPVPVTIGIMASDAPAAIIAENLIQIRKPFDSKANVRAIVLAAGGAAGTRRDAIVESNRVDCDTSSPVFVVEQSELGDRYKDLRLIHNEFSGGECVIQQADDSIIRGNRLLCNFNLEDTNSGIVSDNFVHPVGSGTSGGIRITKATGTWQIEGNRSEGHIILLPATLSSGAFGANMVTAFSNLYARNYSGSEVEWLYSSIGDALDKAGASASGDGVSFGELLGQLGDALFGALFSASGPSRKSPAHGAEVKARTAADAATALNVEPEAAMRAYGSEYIASVEEISLKEVAYVIQDILSGLASAAPIHLLAVEAPYQAQVIGNWAARDLVIGHPPQTVTTKQGITYTGMTADNTGTEFSVTNIQLSDNRADHNLITNDYTHLIKSDNLAGNFIPPVPGSASPTVFHNLKL